MNDERIKSLADAFRSLRLERELRIMEVCGTHTTEFVLTGVRDLFHTGSLGPYNWLLIIGLAFVPVSIIELLFKRAPWLKAE